MRVDSMKGISIEVGDYGWIECKGENEKYTGWFVRVKAENKITYINKEHTSFIVPDKKIKDSSDDFVLYYKVSAIDALNGNFPNLTKEDMVKKNLMTPIENRVMMLNREVAEKNIVISELTSKLHEIEHGTVSTYKLVHGVHDLSNCAKEFTWINDKDLDIKVGDVVEVETTFGIERVIVTRLEDSNVKNNHKPVVRKINKLL